MILSSLFCFRLVLSVLGLWPFHYWTSAKVCQISTKKLCWSVHWEEQLGIIQNWDQVLSESCLYFQFTFFTLEEKLLKGSSIKQAQCIFGKPWVFSAFEILKVLNMRFKVIYSKQICFYSLCYHCWNFKFLQKPASLKYG